MKKDMLTFLLKKLPCIREYMANPVLTLKQDCSIFDAMRFLIDNGISGAPVVNDENKLIGIISEKDCLRLVTKGINNNLPSGKVSDYMTKNVVTISPAMDIYYVAGLFLSNYFRRLPVIENGKLIGQVSRRDVLRAITANMEKK